MHFTVALKKFCIDNQHYCEKHASFFWQSFSRVEKSDSPNQEVAPDDNRFGFKLLAYDEITHNAWIYLRNVSQWIIMRFGYAEGMTFYHILAGTKLKRPMTHEAFSEVIQLLGGQISKVIIDDFCQEDRGFLAKVEISQGTLKFEMDLSAFDALALALVTNVPVLVAPIVIEKSSMTSQLPFQE